MEAHLCQNGKKIRPYPSILCSLCMTKGSVEINDISEEDIKLYNKERKENE